MKYIRYFVPMMVLVVLGCQTRDRGAQFQKPRIISGVEVFGSQGFWSNHKIELLISAVVAVDNTYPILTIKFIDSITAEVTTGIVRGPLNGQGRTYLFVFKDGKWVTDHSSIMIWVS